MIVVKVFAVVVVIILVTLAVVARVGRYLYQQSAKNGSSRVSGQRS